MTAGKFVGDGTTPRHTRPRSGIQVSAANAFGIKTPAPAPLYEDPPRLLNQYLLSKYHVARWFGLVL
jgi:hypothetical protein